jgi:hypothetical protein
MPVRSGQLSWRHWRQQSRVQVHAQSEQRSVGPGTSGCSKDLRSNHRWQVRQGQEGERYNPGLPRVLCLIVSVALCLSSIQAADSLMNRMARQRLLSQGELLFLRRSRVLLRRNLERNMEMDFPLLHLQPYFMSEPHGLLEHVPPVLRLRDLPGFPAKLAVLPVESRRKRLEELLHVLRRRRPSI